MFDRLEKKESWKKGVQASHKPAIREQMKCSGSVFDLPPLSYVQTPIQRMTDDNLSAIQSELLPQFGKKVFLIDEIKKMLRKFFVTQVQGTTTRSDFEQWYNELSQEDAVLCLKTYLTEQQGVATVYSFGDQELGTASDALSSGYRPIATYLHANNSADMERQKALISESGGGVFGPVMLTEGGHMQNAEVLPSGGFSPKPGSFFRRPAKDIDTARSIVAFDHPYTSGYHTNPTTRTEVNELTDNFHAYGKRVGVGRFHLLVRVQDRGGHDTRGVYHLVPTGLYLYAVQRTNVTRHVTTMGKYKGTPIDPTAQSLVYKFADFAVLFHVLHELADELYKYPDVDVLQSAFMLRLKSDLGNRRFPQHLRNVLIQELEKFDQDGKPLSDHNVPHFRKILESILFFDVTEEPTGEHISMRDAKAAGDQEFSDDELE